MLNTRKKSYAKIKSILGVVLTLLFSLPILLVIFIFAILVKLDSEGPAFYTQIRVGKNNEEFKIYKLRSMKINAEKETGATWASVDDPRVTRVGRFIRKTRIDELPQFLNILTGDMCIIGPRPERPDLVSQFEKEIPNFRSRLAVKPGITGLAQVNGGYDISPQEKLELDLQYIENFGFIQDLKIFFLTIKVVITGEGAR